MYAEILIYWGQTTTFNHWQNWILAPQH